MTTDDDDDGKLVAEVEARAHSIRHALHAAEIGPGDSLLGPALMTVAVDVLVSRESTSDVSAVMAIVGALYECAWERRRATGDTHSVRRADGGVVAVEVSVGRDVSERVTVLVDALRRVCQIDEVTCRALLLIVAVSSRAMGVRDHAVLETLRGYLGELERVGGVVTA